MGRFKSALVVLTALLTARSAVALVTVDHVATSNVTNVLPGELVTIQVRLNWDGQGSLRGVTSSTTFNSSVLQFDSNTTAPPTLLFFLDRPNEDIIEGLSRATTSIRQPGDPDSTLRTVQYSQNPFSNPVDPRAATTGAGQYIMDLTFSGIGPGTSTIQTLIANGDLVGRVTPSLQARPSP